LTDFSKTRVYEADKLPFEDGLLTVYRRFV